MKVPNGNSGDPQKSARAEARFRTLFDHAPFSVQLLAPDGRTLHVNRAWEALWQVADGDSIKEFVLGEYNILADPQLETKGIAAPLRRAFAGESVALPTIVYDPAEMGKGGRARWVSAAAHPVLDAEGKVLEVILIHQDVTEQVKAENALRASDMRLKQLANTIPQMAWMAEPDGSIHWYNDRWYEYTGATPDEMLGWGWQGVHDPRELSRVLEQWKSSLVTGEPFQMTFPLRCKDGTFRPFFTLVAPLKDSAGAVVQWFGTNTDVSALHEAQAKLQESDRRKDEFLAMLAHELRNPLAPITTASHLLAMPGADEKRVRHASDVIARQVRHMTELVDDLLDVSRVTRGLVQLKKETLDLKLVVASAIEQVRPLIESRHHVLTTRMASRPVHVHGDRTRLTQVAVNLLNNAAKYTPLRGEIALDLDVADEHVRLTVRDNGLGIDASLLPHVFELFTQAARTPDRAQGGLGIGLALVKSIVQLHEGEAQARSDGPGAGSAFTITLPLAAGEPAPAPAPAAEIAAPSSRPLRIMVVDDNRDAAESLGVLLGIAGHQVTIENDARQALAAAENAAPQVFILDIGLPYMDGYELARRLRMQPAGDRALLVALTGYGQAQDRALSQAAGFDFHFVKPIDMKDLAAVLARAT